MTLRICALLIVSWVLYYCNATFVRDIQKPLYSIITYLHAFVPMAFALFFLKREGISLRYYTNGIKAKHLYVWFLGVFVGIIALLVSTPFVEVNSFYLVALFRSLAIPAEAIWWSAPFIFGAAFLLFGFTFWMVVASCQEAFFRIYLMHKWKHWSFGKMWLVISFVWFLWLLPIHARNEMHMPLLNVALKCFVYSASLTMILLIFAKNSLELSVPSLFMGMIQSLESGIYLIAPAANTHYYGVTGWVGVGILFIVACVSYLLVRGDIVHQRPELN